MAHFDMSLKNKKIVFLISFFGRGGSQRQAYLLGREFRDRYGLDAEVWALEQGGDYADEIEAACIPTRTLDFERPLMPGKLLRVCHWAGRLQRVARQLKERRV